MLLFRSAWDHALDLLFHYLPQIVSRNSSGNDVNPTELEEYAPSSQSNQVLHQLRPNLPVMSTEGLDDIPRELLELTTDSAKRLTRLLHEVDKQVLEARRQKQKKTGYKLHLQRREDGDKKRPEVGPPPGYESGAAPPSSTAVRCFLNGSRSELHKNIIMFSNVIWP